MPPDKPPPLPVAADRAAISNRLSMLFSQRTNLIKKLMPAEPLPTAAARHVNHTADKDDVLFGTPANQGVGYVPTGAATDTKRQDGILRGRMLGKRKAGGAEARFRKDESESDEEEGRGSLGRRKRVRRVGDAGAGAGAGARAETGTATATEMSVKVETTATERSTGMETTATETSTGTETGNAMEAQEGGPQTAGAGPGPGPGPGSKKKKKKKKGKGKGKSEDKQVQA